jgi:hypothetical protein
MRRSAAKDRGKRLAAALAVACLSAALAACSETSGTVKPSAAVTTPAPAAQAFVDAGQPLVLSGAAPATQTAGTQPGNVGPAAAPAAAAAVATPVESPRMATAMVEPSTADIAPPVADPAVTAAPETSADGVGGPLVEAPDATTETLSDAPAASPKISASAKAKLIGELQALKKRPGAAASKPETTAPAAAAATDCPEGSIEPQCLAAAD